MTTPARFHVLCLETDAACRAELHTALDGQVGSALEVTSYGDAESFGRALEQLAVAGDHLALVIVGDAPPELVGTQFLIDLHGDPWGRSARKVLLTAGTPMDDLGRAMNAHALDGTLRRPWTEAEIKETSHRLITEYFLEHAPESVERIGGIIDTDLLSAAFADSERRLQRTGAQLRALQRSFFTDRDLSDDEVEARMIAEIDHALERPERLEIPAGEVLLTEGQSVDGIWIITEGRVRLTRLIDGEEEVFHSRTAGRIVGLLAVTRGRRAFFTCTAATGVKAIRLSLEQLDEALRTSPALAVHFVTVLLRSMARRNLRSIEMQVAIDRLNRDLAAERDQLALALSRLEQAQIRLVESEKMATLGQLAAGIGHELNNPLAAIERAAEFLATDLTAVAEDQDDAGIRDMLQAALRRPPLSTREERTRRNELAADLGDESLARRLTAIGIITPTAAAALTGGLAGDALEARLDVLERYHQIGTSLHNIRASARRVGGLVNSLRAYSRGGAEPEPDIDVRDGIEETLLLLGHRLRDVEVVRDYGDVPRISGYPGRLNQAWTNLIQNAVDAMEERGVLTVRIAATTGERLEVCIEDTGPGIPPEHIDQIFDMHFTTRGGRVEFGLGLGLQITKDVVLQHGGTITVASQPGQTRFTVTLPAAAANDESEEGT
jgi:signal transduction histidine kinase